MIGTKRHLTEITQVRRVTQKRRTGYSSTKKSGESGFTLLEAVIGLLMMMIVALGSASLFSYSVYNNSAGSDRATSIAIAQQELERLRNAEFSSTNTDSRLNFGTSQSNVIQDGRTFILTISIDDDPSTEAINNDPNTNLKEIAIVVTPGSIGGGWAFGAGGTITLITQRARSSL